MRSYDIFFLLFFGVGARICPGEMHVSDLGNTALRTGNNLGLASEAKIHGAWSKFLS